MDEYLLKVILHKKTVAQRISDAEFGSLRDDASEIIGDVAEALRERGLDNIRSYFEDSLKAFEEGKVKSYEDRKKESKALKSLITETWLGLTYTSFWENGRRFYNLHRLGHISDDQLKTAMMTFPASGTYYLKFLLFNLPENYFYVEEIPPSLDGKSKITIDLDESVITLEEGHRLDFSIDKNADLMSKFDAEKKITPFYKMLDLLGQKSDKSFKNLNEIEL